MIDLPTAFHIFEYLLLAVFAVFAVCLLILSIVIHDTSFITSHPFVFLIELIVVAVGTALPVFVFGWSQKIESPFVNILFWAFAIKIGVFHILCHLSGFYRYFFTGKVRL